jgi:DNA polymerase III epsilon subunit-like protein
VDVEWTDSANKSSICEIGLARFEEGKLTESWRSYVRPPGKFSVGFMELRTHGIKAHLLEDAPSLSSIWPTIEEFTEDRGWVLHNATNDVNRILHSLVAGGFSAPRDFDYIDSMGLARKFSWVQSSSSLDALAEYFDLEREFASYEGREKFSTPHGAVEDAQLTGLVLQRMIELTGYSNLTAFMKVLEVDPGRVRGGQLLNGFSARGGFSYSHPSELPPQDQVLKAAAKATQQAAKAEERKKAAEDRKAQFLRSPEWSTRRVGPGDKVCFTQLMPWGEGSQNHEAEVHKVANRLGIELRYSLRSDLDLLVVNDPWVFESAKLRDALSRKNPIPVTTYSVFQKNNPEFPVWKYAKSPEYRELVRSGLWPEGQQ